MKWVTSNYDNTVLNIIFFKYTFFLVNKRLVNLTESIWPKIGLNMTKTDEPYLFEHDRKVTTANINLLNSTKNDWIWPKIENILFSVKFTCSFLTLWWFLLILLFSVIFNHSSSLLWQFLFKFLVMFNKFTFVAVIFRSCSNILVILIRSC